MIPIHNNVKNVKKKFNVICMNAMIERFYIYITLKSNVLIVQITICQNQIKMKTNIFNSSQFCFLCVWVILLLSTHFFILYLVTNNYFLSMTYFLRGHHSHDCSPSWMLQRYIYSIRSITIAMELNI